jgi:hypothetical protein
MLSNAPLALDDHDPRVMAAEAAEKEFYDFCGISCTTRHIMLPRHGIRVRITETGEGDPVVVRGNSGGRSGGPATGPAVKAQATRNFRLAALLSAAPWPPSRRDAV